MEELFYIFILIIVSIVSYALTQRVTKDSTLAFIIALVVLVAGLVGRYGIGL